MLCDESSPRISTDCRKHPGPAFGGDSALPPDLFVGDNQQGSTCHFPQAYHRHGFTARTLAGGERFDLEAIEVFGLDSCGAAISSV